MNLKRITVLHKTEHEVSSHFFFVKECFLKNTQYFVSVKTFLHRIIFLTNFSFLLLIFKPRKNIAKIEKSLVFFFLISLLSRICCSS